MSDKRKIKKTRSKSRLGEAASDVSRAVSGYAGRVWDLISVTNLNRAFAREMVSSSDANMVSTGTVDDGLKKVDEESRMIATEITAAAGEITAATQPFQTVSDAILSFTSALSEMDQNFEEVGSAFQQVNTAAKGIAKTVEEIDSISRLTNLLALNATLEAARAGKFGRSFAVVAKDVKELAGRTAELTNNITDLLETLTSNVEKTMSGLGAFGNTREDVSQKAVDAKNALGESDQALQTASSRMTRVSTSVKDLQERVELMVDLMKALRWSVNNVAESGRHITDNLDSEEVLVAAIGQDDTRLRDGTQKLNDVLQDTGVVTTEKDVIVVGHDLAYPPWCYLENGLSAGLSIEILNLVAAELGLTLSYQPKQFMDVLRDFKAGRTRIILNAGWPNPLLEEAGALPTAPYAAFEPVVFVPKTEDLDANADPSLFDGKHLAYQAGSYTEHCMRNYGATMEPVENDIQGMANLIWRKVNGVVTERLVGAHISHRFFHDEIAAGSTPCERVDVVMALSKRDDHLRKKISTLLGKPAFKARLEKILGNG